VRGGLQSIGLARLTIGKCPLGNPVRSGFEAVAPVASHRLPDLVALGAIARGVENGSRVDKRDVPIPRDCQMLLRHDSQLCLRRDSLTTLIIVVPNPLLRAEPCRNELISPPTRCP
jgi:hypothetical protein